MEVNIIKNMEEVLKKTRKSKNKKSRTPQATTASEANGDSISEILNKKWMFSSPPAQEKEPEDESSPKLNAFQLMMSKKPEPLAQLSPEVNGVRKKRKYVKKPKNMKVETVDGLAHDENEAHNEAEKTEEIKGDEHQADEDKQEVPKRKRNRAMDNSTPIASEANKKRKTKLLLDSNENSIEAPLDAPMYQSGRPRRSCAGNVNYEHLISPDKANSPPVEQETPEKRSTRSQKSKKDPDESIETLIVEEDSSVKKLAPLFVKKLPKPSVDPTVKEARRNFLLSGLPEDLRSTIDRQKLFEDEFLANELVAFPSISHVTQLASDASEAQDLWREPRVKIAAGEDECEGGNLPRLLTRGMFTKCGDDDLPPVICDEIHPVERRLDGNLKAMVKQLKEDFESFPTNRCFRQLHAKRPVVENDSDYLSGSDGTDENLLFVDIFKPRKFDEFHVNVKPVKLLRKFLLTWNERIDYDSDDSASQNSTKGTNNFAVLSGPSGSGKTSSVYAVASDLNYQVIEINAGSRRSGKKILQDLLEATQSHRVKNGLYTSQDDSDNSQDSNGEAPTGAKSIILIEDAELAFESDDGFVSSIQQLINISKRPVVLTTNNRHCQHLQKLIQHNGIMYDSPANANRIGIGKYLSLLCLAADYQINAVAIQHLYSLNGHDLRRTINEIEFFIRSGNTAGNGGDMVEFYRRPRRERLAKGRLNYGNKSLSTVCFESSIVSSFVALPGEWADGDENSYQRRDLMEAMAEFLVKRCDVAEESDGEQQNIAR